MKLDKYGVTPKMRALAGMYSDWHLARVISQSRDIYKVVTDEDEFFGEVSGKFMYDAVTRADYPAVGDYVMLDRKSGKEGNGIIHKVLDRNSAFIRKAAGSAAEEQVVAANADKVFLCMSLNQDFNIRRLERYIALGWESGAIPVVVLTKSDLCEDIEEKKCEVEAVAVGIDIVIVNSVEEDGYAKISDYIEEGKTYCFVGSSGVGKSTLINRLLGEEKLLTNEIREDDKGRHTTTHRELIPLAGGGVLIDTPGMRELGMIQAEEGIGQSFADVEVFLGQCKFSNCTHNGEKGCAVQQAIDNGELLEERWTSYQKLLQENFYEDDKAGFMQKKNEKFKMIAKINKNNRKW